MYVRTKEIRVSKFDLSGNQRSVRGRKYISVNWIMRAILPSSRYLIQHRYYIHIYVVIEIIRTCYEKRTRFSIDRRYPPFDVSFFGGRKEFKRRGDLAKAIRIKKRGKEKMKSGKERGRQRLFHHDRHVFPSSTNYDLFEFVRVLRVSSIFLARYSYTRFQSTRLNYAHVRQRNQDK